MVNQINHFKSLGGTDTPIVAISLYYPTLINVQGKSTQRGDEMFRGRKVSKQKNKNKTPTHGDYPKWWATPEGTLGKLNLQ